MIKNGNQDTSPAGLMARYCAGEAAAFWPLYELLAPDLFAHLLDRTGDRARAEALLERTFLELHEGRSSYVRGADPLPWAMTIAEHFAVRLLRRQPRSAPHWQVPGPTSSQPTPSVG
jgi:DNA-directed RNA polymerase specialized sigma24 family protein